MKRLENISYSADSLSDSDILETVFDFELSSYVALNTIKATSKCNKKGFVKFPQFLGRTATINKNKREKINGDDKLIEIIKSVSVQSELKVVKEKVKRVTK